MMHKAWSSIEEVPYCFSRSYVKFQGHTALKIIEFDPNWAFPDSNSSLNSPMAMKCCTKLETAKERCPIVFQGHPSNFKVTRDKTSPILTQIGRFRIIGRSQLSNPSDLPCLFIFIPKPMLIYHHLDCSKSTSIKFDSKYWYRWVSTRLKYLCIINALRYCSYSLSHWNFLFNEMHVTRFVVSGHVRCSCLNGPKREPFNFLNFTLTSHFQ